jgi:hypothetical protein
MPQDLEEKPDKYRRELALAVSGEVAREGPRLSVGGHRSASKQEKAD